MKLPNETAPTLIEYFREMKNSGYDFFKDLNLRKMAIEFSHKTGQQRAAKVGFMPKTKRPRKVHFVWADTNDTKCEVRVSGSTLYTKWAPEVTCSICRDMMVNRGITGIR